MNRNLLIIIGIVGLLFVLAACVCGLIAAGTWAYFSIDEASSGQSASVPVPTLDVRPPVSDSAQAAPAAVYTGTLQTLEETIVPVNDLIDLSRRLKGLENIPAAVDSPAAPLEIGSERSFWVTNIDTNENFIVDANLRYITDHLYFWIGDGVSYRESDLQALADTFEEEIYPTNREFFGSEWTPGVDGDPHLYVLYAAGMGSSIAGYFYSADEYPPQVHKYSNAHEMFMLNADNVSLDEEFAYGVLAHEFQHMIHWYRDRNEDTWMNEGFADLAMFSNGYDIGGMDYLYVRDPDIQLTDWPTDMEGTGPHYGASFLFLTYFLDRFGEDATKALIAEAENGMVSIDQLLAESEMTDSISNQPIDADGLFADWVVASYLQDGRAADGRYTYHNYPNAPQPSETERIRSCPSSGTTSDVSQYGVDYIRITCPGEYTLRFEGSTQVGVLPADPYSGDYAFWSNKGDESDMTLTREFDFTGYSGPLTLQYWTWYDIEEDYDYLYLEGSTDGEDWQILTTPSGTGEDPSGNSFGWAYNGFSGAGPEWIQEEVDISQYAGQKVALRFEYVTDAAVNGEGFLLDDIAVPEIGYFEDYEADEGGWEGEGFVRIQNILPQTFELSLIHQGGATTVERVELSGENFIELPVEIGGEVDEVVVAVSGTTRFTRQRGAYRISITSRQ